MKTLVQYISQQRQERLGREDSDRSWVKRLCMPDFIDMFNETSFQVFFDYQELGDQILGARFFYADMMRSEGDTVSMGGDVLGERNRQLAYAEELRDQAIYERRELSRIFPEIMFHPLSRIIEEELMAEEEYDKNDPDEEE